MLIGDRADRAHGGPQAAKGAAARAVRHVWHHYTQVAEYADVGPIMLVEGHGPYVKDSEGREYLDAVSIMGVSQIGHGRDEMADAIAAQVRKLEYSALATGFSHPVAAELATRLAELTPGTLEVTFFSSSGSEAVETALKMARQYQAQVGAPRRTKIIARRNSYHGITLGALSATGQSSLRTPFEPLLPGFRHIPQPYLYRSEAELGCGPDEVGERAAQALEAQILFEDPETVAAFIAEPVAIPGALKVPPPDYWPRIQDICTRYGLLLIVDEVFCGFGRTGRWFGSQHWNVQPDIMTVSKGITSGYIPLSGAIATREVADAFWGDRDRAFQHAGTYSGHQVGCAAALANLQIMEREDLIENARVMGTRLLTELKALEDLPLVGHVSGIGLLLGIELVVDKRQKTPAPARVAEDIRTKLRHQGVLARAAGHCIYFYPPLVIEEQHVTKIATSLRIALLESAQEVDQQA